MAGITEAGKTDNQCRDVEDEDRPPGLQRRTDKRMRRLEHRFKNAQ